MLTYADNGDLSKKIIDNKIDVIYIAQGEKERIHKVLKVTQSEKILSCTGKAEYVNSCGVTMSVGLKDKKPKIYLNLSSAKSEGADFSAKFLRVAEIVDSKQIPTTRLKPICKKMLTGKIGGVYIKIPYRS